MHSAHLLISATSLVKLPLEDRSWGYIELANGGMGPALRRPWDDGPAPVGQGLAGWQDWIPD